MPTIHLDFVPAPTDRPDCTVVFDVLRMTTTAAALFSRGLDRLAVVADADEARVLASETGALLFGERGGLPLDGFDGGNSPLEHLERDHSGRRAILCTTNGSKAVEAAAGARHVLLGSIVNASAVAEHVVRLGCDDVTLSCAGTDGRPSLDDVLGAGVVLQALLRRSERVALSDACRMALAIAEAPGGVRATLREAAHARLLIALGFDDDVAYASNRDSLSVVPERVAGSHPTFVAAPGTEATADRSGHGG